MPKRLETPDAIRKLQRKLYVKAKTEPKYRFYSLIDKIHRRDVLEYAYRLAKSNAGAPGVDGETFARIEEAGLEEWLRRLEEDLRRETYRPAAVRRVYIPKPGGGRRPLGIPTIRDRVAQTAAVIVLEPIFEADLADEMYGYRPRRSAQGAVVAVHTALREGYTHVVDADLSKYLDAASHYPPSVGLGVEETRRSRWDLDSQALTSATAYVHGLEFAALDPLQHSLARDAEDAHGVDDRHEALWCVLDEAGAQLVRPSRPTALPRTLAFRRHRTGPGFLHHRGPRRGRLGGA